MKGSPGKPGQHDMLKDRKLPIGALKREPVDYLSGFFGEFTSRDDMISLANAVKAGGATHVYPAGAEDEEVDRYMQEIVDRMRDGVERKIRRDHGTAAARFMRGYFDGLSPISFFQALNMALSLSTNKDAAKRSC